VFGVATTPEPVHGRPADAPKSPLAWNAYRCEPSRDGSKVGNPDGPGDAVGTGGDVVSPSPTSHKGGHSVDRAHDVGTAT
jgi:hypothetical protein